MGYDEYELYTCEQCPYFVKSEKFPFCRYQDEDRKGNQKVCEEYGQIIEDYYDED